MKRTIARALLGLGLAVFIAWPGVARSMESTPTPTAFPSRTHGPARVFILHSFSENDLWVQQVDGGILKALAEAGYSAEDGTLELGRYWLNAKYYTSRDYMVNIAAAAQRAIEDFGPDVVIAADNQAITWVVAKWGDEALPFVFTGLTVEPDAIRGLSERIGVHVTGVEAPAFYTRTLDWIHYVLPNVQRVLFLSDGSRSPETEGERLEAARLAHYQRHDVAPEHAAHIIDSVALHAVGTFADWQKEVLEAPQNADVLVVVSYLTLVDDRGGKMDSAEVMRWTVENSEIPVVAMAEDTVIQGALGGMVIAGDEQGRLAGQLAARVLDGEAISDIDVVVPRRGKLVLNIEAIQRWHVDVPLSLLQVSTLYGPDGQVVNQ